MASITRILVPFENDERSMRAMEYAAMFASGIGAQITALFLTDQRYYHNKEELRVSVQNVVDNQLHPKIVSLQKEYPDVKDINIRMKKLDKNMHRIILDTANELGVDFIVLRSHGNSVNIDLSSHFTTTNAYKVVLESQCPVFTFNEIPKVAKIENILVPIDLSAGSLYKVPFAAQIASQFQATIHLISSTEKVYDRGFLETQLELALNEIYDMKLKIKKYDVFNDQVSEVIRNMANEMTFDLMIIMNRNRFRWKDLWISPLAKQLIYQSKIPVVSLRANKPYRVEF